MPRARSGPIMSAACCGREICSRPACSGSARTSPPERLREIEDAAIRDVVKLQEDAGLQGITDGELRRDYWHLDFLTQIGGVEFEEGNKPLKWHRHDGVRARMGAAGGEGACAPQPAEADPGRRLQVSEIGRPAGQPRSASPRPR